MGWEVILSNNETIKQNENDVTSWRQLKEKCTKEILKIKSLTENGHDPHPGTPISSYFAVYDIFVPDILKGHEQHIKFGIGCFYKGENRCRIKWSPVQGTPMVYTEIIQDGSSYRELEIEKE